MQIIYLLTDYKGRFGTKYTAVPYRSGMDRDLLGEEFRSHGLDARFVRASEVFERVREIKGNMFLYTSSEDMNSSYKSFLDDVVLAIDTMKGIVVPAYVRLHAHNNKVFMEMLKKEWGGQLGDTLRSECFGSLQDLDISGSRLPFPVVVKRPEGFKSRGVFLAKNMSELRHIVKNISSTPDVYGGLKDRIRTVLHKGFVPESQHRKKFLLQEFIPGLTGDWKILVYGQKYYPLLRQTRRNDFRASGSGLLSYPEELPEGLLDFAERAIEHFNVPNVSLDIARDPRGYHLLETQFLYFGTYTIEHSDFYFIKRNDGWFKVNEKSLLEREYANSIAEYLIKNPIA